MARYYVDNLGIVITNRCNLNCDHCIRGKKNSQDIKNEVIDEIFNQIVGVGMLNICGGEPLLALDKIEYLFNKIIENKIHVETIAITINGTIYNQRFESLLDKINEYLKARTGGDVFFAVSLDKYHQKEMKRLGLDYNFDFLKSKYFYMFRELDEKLKLFREGNAENLSESETLPLRAVQPMICDLGNKYKSISHIIGPFVCINTNGTITEDNTSIEKQETEYNYGNILKDDLVKTLQAKGFKTFKYEWLYNFFSDREVKRYMTYKK